MAVNLQEQTLARLSFSATAIDLAVTIFFVKLLLPLFSFFDNPFLNIGCALVSVLFVHLVITEFMFGHRSIGRLCVGLTTQAHNGNSLPDMKQRSRSFIAKATRFGLDSLNFNRVPRAYRGNNLELHSDLMRTSSSVSRSPGGSARNGNSGRSDIGAWELVVLTGAHAGTRLALRNTAVMSSVLKIGRDTAWADLDLNRDNLISGRHCVLQVRSGVLQIADHAVLGKPSTNGTFVNRRRLEGKSWHKLDRVNEFRVADTVIRIKR
ncbi:MAG: FHA domain-containing protein [Pseudomonadota bacterium]